VSSFSKVGIAIFKDSLSIGNYFGLPPIVPLKGIS
jgi:hypothetical protein